MSQHPVRMRTGKLRTQPASQTTLRFIFLGLEKLRDVARTPPFGRPRASLREGQRRKQSYFRRCSSRPLARTWGGSEWTQDTNRQADENERRDDMTANRWGIAAAGFVLQVGLGAVYAWSIFRVPLSRQFHWSISEVTLTFTICIFVLGVSAFFGGHWIGLELHRSDNRSCEMVPRPPRPAYWHSGRRVRSRCAHHCTRCHTPDPDRGRPQDVCLSGDRISHRHAHMRSIPPNGKNWS